MPGQAPRRARGRRVDAGLLAAAEMPQLGPAEILVVFVVALLVFGPNRLPEVGKQIGRAIREIRRLQAGVRDEIRDALDLDGEQEARRRALGPAAEGDAVDADADDMTVDGDPPTHPAN